MQSLERILVVLNELVILLWQILLHTLFVLTPPPIRYLCRRLKLGFRWLESASRKNFIPWVNQVISCVVFIFKKISRPFVRFEKAFQVVVETAVDEIRNTKISDLTPQRIGRKFLQIFGVIFYGIFYIWKRTWGNMNGQLIASICALVVICLIACWKIYDTSTKLYVEIKFNGRKPASEFELKSTLKRRPDYYKQENRHYEIKQLRVPVYIEAEHSIKIFEVDITIESSNRFVTRFFSESENLIRDRLFSTTEPMVHGFPLSDEGKNVMKEKISHELTNFIKENGIEGEVRQIYFNSIIAM